MRVRLKAKPRQFSILLIAILLFAEMLFLLAVNPVSAFSLATSNDGLLSETTNCTVSTGVSYSSDDNPYHHMDVYLPVGDGPFPAFIYIHGGGWVRGNRSEYDFLGQLYAKRGIAGFSIDYSLTVSAQKQSSWPDVIQDVVRAIRYVRENAKQFRVDPDKIALMGDSAGAQLASLASMLNGNESFLQGASGNPSVSNHVSLVVDYYGPTDFRYIGEYGESFRTYYIIARFLGNVSYQMNQSIWTEASPATYITSQAPVFFIVHGTNDSVVPISISDSFVSKLNAAGLETHFLRVKDGDHQILTTQEENLQVRYALEPLLKRVFNIQPGGNLDISAVAAFALALLATMVVIILVRRKRLNRSSHVASFSNAPMRSMCLCDW